MTFDFPWPHKDLSPNARVDRWTKAKRVKAYRQGVAWEAKAAGIKPMPVGETHVTITFLPPDRRPRDIDNMLASVKAALDGIADVVQVDDSWWTLTIKRGDVVPGGRVMVSISQTAADAVLIPFAGQIS